MEPNEDPWHTATNFRNGLAKFLFPCSLSLAFYWSRILSFVYAVRNFLIATLAFPKCWILNIICCLIFGISPLNSYWDCRLTTFQFDDLDEGFQILLKLAFKYTDNIIFQTTYGFYWILILCFAGSCWICQEWFWQHWHSCALTCKWTRGTLILIMEFLSSIFLAHINFSL